jgi:hypothetical protein
MMVFRCNIAMRDSRSDTSCRVPNRGTRCPSHTLMLRIFRMRKALCRPPRLASHDPWESLSHDLP